MPTCRAPRNVYIDAGVNWGQTLLLHEALPGPSNSTLVKSRLHQPTFHAATPWLVFGFEPSAFMTAHAQLCADALNAKRSMPMPPITLASSSSAELYELASRASNCTMQGDRRLECAFAHAAGQLASLTKEAELSEEALRRRLATARSCATVRDMFTIIPAAVGARNGVITLLSSRNALLKGGLMLPSASTASRTDEMKFGQKETARVVDLVGWMRRSFDPTDFVLLKLDVEGSEQHVVPALARQPDVAALVDVIVWECHVGGKRPCHELLDMLKASGVGAIYAEPKSWSWRRALCTAPLWRQASLRRQSDSPERSHVCRSRSWWSKSKSHRPSA